MLELHSMNDFLKVYLKIVGDVVAQWLLCQTWDQKVESSSPSQCTYVVFLGKTLNSHSATLHPGVYKWEPANCLGSNLRWTSIPLGEVEIFLVASYYRNWR